MRYVCVCLCLCVCMFGLSVVCSRSRGKSPSWKYQPTESHWTDWNYYPDRSSFAVGSCIYKTVIKRGSKGIVKFHCSLPLATQTRRVVFIYKYMCIYTKYILLERERPNLPRPSLLIGQPAKMKWSIPPWLIQLTSWPVATEFHLTGRRKEETPGTDGTHTQSYWNDEMKRTSLRSNRSTRRKRSIRTSNRRSCSAKSLWNFFFFPVRGFYQIKRRTTRLKRERWKCSSI